MSIHSDPSIARPNRLIRETSPYLLQHAHNPVDWYAWGPEAFDAARKQNKPIFLSVGYSTCYWCHVMERQSFEVEPIAAEMNRRFINIKVDREERPDVDQLYMTAVQVLTHHGGWPMSVFLTPDLRPFYGGTYFPPTDQHGRPGFVTLLRGIDEAWQERRADVEKSADQLVQILRRIAEPEPPARTVSIDDPLLADLIDRSTADYEARFGGFGTAPKFPRETLLELLLVYLDVSGPTGPDALRHDSGQASNIAKRRLEISEKLHHALLAMAHGGIRDHLGGGFHRYSTDAQWLVPHFEIMLYDNAMLGWCYTEAYRQSADPRYAEISRGIFDFIGREMTSPDGAFYTALDAEVDAQEGLSYLWTLEEVGIFLAPEDAAVFNRAYGVDRGPNFADPHHGSGTPDKNILFLGYRHDRSDGDSSSQTTVQSALLDPNLDRMRRKLYEARRKRKQPLLDTKIITSWNALMIRALAHGGKVLNEPRYIEAATRAADFLLQHHRRPDGGLLRTSGGGTTREGGPSTEPGAAPPSIGGFLDDYAFLVQALLALEEAGAVGQWRSEAETLSRTMLERFGDRPSRVGTAHQSSATDAIPTVGGAHPTRGFFFTERDAKDLIIRQKVGTDSPLPSGNAIAALAMLALDRPDAARGTLSFFAESMQRQGEGMSAMVQAALLYVRQKGAFTVASQDEGELQDRPLSPQQMADQVVAVKTEWRTPRELLVHLSILRGFHVNAHNPQSADVPLIPTRLTVTDPAGAVESIDYPPGELQSLAFAEAPIRVYSGEVTIAVRFTTPIIGRGVKLSISYQACEESACLPEVRKMVETAAS